MSDERGLPQRNAPGWAGLDRVERAITPGSRNVYAALSDEQLLRALDAAERGEPDPPDVNATLRLEAARLGPDPRFEGVTDDQLLRRMRRDAATLEEKTY